LGRDRRRKQRNINLLKGVGREGSAIRQGMWQQTEQRKQPRVLNAVGSRDPRGEKGSRTPKTVKGIHTTRTLKRNLPPAKEWEEVKRRPGDGRGGKKTPRRGEKKWG